MTQSLNQGPLWSNKGITIVQTLLKGDHIKSFQKFEEIGLDNCDPFRYLQVRDYLKIHETRDIFGTLQYDQDNVESI